MLNSKLLKLMCINVKSKCNIFYIKTNIINTILKHKNCRNIELSGLSARLPYVKYMKM